MRGMFDGPTSTGLDTWTSPAVCLDLSAVGVGSGASNLALAIMMVCATAFLDGARQAHARELRERGGEPPRVIRVNDEAWRALPVAGLGDYYQAAFKLSRATGVQHWMVLHRLSDLDAAGDHGTRQQALAKGLLAEASTVVIYRQAPREAPVTAELLGLSSTARAEITRLGQGEALWWIQGRLSLVRHLLTPAEWQLIGTDQAMAIRDPEMSA